MNGKDKLIIHHHLITFKIYNMKLLTKIFKIFFGSAIFLFSVLSMFKMPGFSPVYFSMDVIRFSELILFYFAMHGISIIVWAVKNEDPIHEFRIEVPNSNEEN
jgi:hypothetical protein